MLLAIVSNIYFLGSKLHSDLKKLVVKDKTNILIKCIKNAHEYPYFNLVEPGLQCGLLAGNILKTYGINFEEISTDIANEMLKLMEQPSGKCKEKEKFFQHYYNITISDVLFQKWSNFVNFVDNTASDQLKRILFQFILDKHLQYILEVRNEIALKSKDNNIDDDITITSYEEKILRYVCGYIGYTLKRKFKKLSDGTVKTMLLALVNSWTKDDSCDSETTALQSTNDWVSKVDRGGLFKVNDQFYIFIRNVECEARKLLNIKLLKVYRGENLQNMLLENFQDSETIDRQWSNLTSRIECDSLKEKLKLEVFKKWINIRGNAFVKSWCNIVKIKQLKNKSKQIDAKGKKSLRQTLN